MSPLSPARTARLAAGALLATASVVAAALLVTTDVPGHVRDAIAVSAQPPAAASVASCAGPLLAIGRDSSQAAMLADAAPQALTVGVGGGADAEQTPLRTPDVTEGAGPVAVVAQPVDGAPADLAAAGSSRVADDDLAGFAASACTRAAMESWLVAGAATTGAADLVTLANPGDVPALVNLTVYGASGESAPAAGQQIVVAAGAQRVIPLAALALGEENPIIRVTAAQAPVRAGLQAELTRVLTPGGVDQVSAVGAPAAELVIPGVPVTIAPGDPGASDAPASLRLLAPASDGEATVTVRGTSGAVGDAQVVPLTAGVPLQLDLSALAIGTYTVEVSATTPVAGAVWATSGFDEGSDFGWYSAAEVLTATTSVAIAAGPSPVLTIVAADGAEQVVTITDDDDDDDAREITLAAGEPAEVPVTAGVVYRIEPGDAGVRAAVTYAGRGAMAGYPVQASDAAASAIVVYPR